MTQSISTLSKKTKAEILNEYEKLVSSLESAKEKSREVNEPLNIGAVASAKHDFTTTGVELAIQELRASTAEKLADVSKKVSSTLDALMQETLAGVEKFATLTQAIELSEKRLASQYHIEVVATTLDNLVKEYEGKKEQFELEQKKRDAELAESIAIKKRDHEREEEVYSYTLKTTRAREQAEYAENSKKKIAELVQREQALKASEDAIAALRAHIDSIPAQNEKLIRATEQDVTKRLTAEHNAHIDLITKAWESEKRILELKYSHLESQHKKFESEMNQMKKEVESAQKKAQELAITVIEHGGSRLQARNDVRDTEDKSSNA